jgi:hypothetical protein
MALPTFVVEILEWQVALQTFMGSFHFVRLAPHFGQDDKLGRWDASLTLG